MGFLVAIRAAIFDDQQSVVCVGGVAQRQNTTPLVMIPVGIRVSMPLARSGQVEIGPGEGRLTRCLVTTISSASGATARMDLRTFGPRSECARGLESVERRISVADLRVAGAEADDHIDPTTIPAMRAAAISFAVRLSSAFASAA